MPFKAVIFDLDGTLLNTIEDIADAANAVLQRRGFPQHDLKTYKHYVGEGIEKLVERALPDTVTGSELVHQCVAAMRQEYRSRWHNKTRSYDGIPELLDRLVDRGIRLTILSNKPDDFTKMMVESFLPQWHFEMVQGADSSIPRKPDPSAALRIARTLAVPENEFLFVGDSGIDMQTSVAAGMFPVGALWGFRTAEELIANGARALLGKPLELLELLG